MKTRKVPERRCVGCGISFPKSDLIRIVRTPEGEVVLDATGRKNGRGAYICHSAECLGQSRKKRRLERAFSCAIADEVYEKLEKELIVDGQQ